MKRMLFWVAAIVMPLGACSSSRAFLTPAYG